MLRALFIALQHGFVQGTVASALLAGSALGLAPAAAHAQFRVGLQDPDLEAAASSPAARNAYGVMRKVDGSIVRVNVPWRSVAPAGTVVPADFNPTDPADPHYNWGAVDIAVRTAAQHHVAVLMMLYAAPAWAEGPGRPADPNIAPGAWNPNPRAFAGFAQAVARRYSGSFPDPLHPGSAVPRVKNFEIWNEENLPYYLAAPDLVGEYRTLLNAGYGAIKSVRQSDVVTIGGFAPVSFLPRSISPLKFAADLLCLRRTGTVFQRAGSCPQRAEFDVFAHHPYTLAATPTKHAIRYDDVLVGDMQKIAAVVHAADKLHTILPNIRHQIWVTEWGWLTNPPNTQVGDSEAKAARYVAYSMYEMWRSAVSVVIWQRIYDVPNLDAQGRGLYTISRRPKLTAKAFAFPVVASIRRGRGLVWGRVPVSHRVRVVVQRRSGHRWRSLATVRTGSDGVFEFRFTAHGNGLYRARVVHGAVSLPYDSQPIPGRRTHMFDSG